MSENTGIEQPVELEEDEMDQVRGAGLVAEPMDLKSHGQGQIEAPNPDEA